MTERATIRPATPADLDRLVALEQVFPTDRISRRNFRRQIASPSLDLRVAERDGRVVGYVLTAFRRGSRGARIYSLVVDPQDGRGLGRVLLETAESVARARGATRVRLEVREDNERAIALYVRNGYALIETIPDYYDDGCAAQRYEKEL